MKSEDSVALWCLRQHLQQLSQHPAKLRVDHTGLRFDHSGFGSMVIVFFQIVITDKPQSVRLDTDCAAAKVLLFPLFIILFVKFSQFLDFL